ncbi:hypothetical protein M408DRAFT_327292 [Serendipita vermifera MAFF 305830]|uniref:Anaphase-promoting complex subunit 11 n=1 Tax=Serendipita vermifera MAFF 305830 TaxID=933852 RepID=A0A0C3BID8_SERVB|nr:hypothetical protein M408DRAFT_327292 [Serendipita vermifera MAFF 305830]
MRVIVHEYHSVAQWRWKIEGRDETTEEDDEDEVCGICRVAYDGCCPDCNHPGDDCPLICGKCTHVFHMHCIEKWINTASSNRQCPMDRRTWVPAGSTETADP